MTTRPLGEREYPIRPLAMDQIIQACTRRGHGAPPVIDLCLGSSQFDTATLVDLKLSVRDLLSAFPYGDLMGLPDLRNALSKHYAAVYGVDVSPDRFLITDGASGALQVAFITLLAPGDHVILPGGACFPVYKLLAHMAGVKCVFAPLNEQRQYDTKELRKLITPKTRAIVLNSPNNPFGTSLTSDQVDEILEMGLSIVSDEVYGELHHEAPAATIASKTLEHFVINSFSKAYGAAGFRVGYAIVPEKYIPAARTIKATLNVCTSLPAQLLACQLLAEHDDIISKHRTFLSQQAAHFRKVCRESGVGLLLEPTAGFYGIVDVSGVRKASSTEVALELLREHHVAVCPSADFGDPDPMFLRVNFSAPRSYLTQGLERIAWYLASQRAAE